MEEEKEVPAKPRKKLDHTLIEQINSTESRSHAQLLQHEHNLLKESKVLSDLAEHIKKRPINLHTSLKVYSVDKRWLRLFSDGETLNISEGQEKAELQELVVSRDDFISLVKEKLLPESFGDKEK